MQFSAFTGRPPKVMPKSGCKIQGFTFITLSFPKVHPGRISSKGILMMQKKIWFIRPDQLLPLFHSPRVLGANDPVVSSPVLLPWATFGRFWPLHTEKPPQVLSCWDVQTAQFGFCQSVSDPFYLRSTLTSRTVRLYIYLLSGATVLRTSILFISLVSGF